MGIRRLRLEYVILLERLEERAIMIPNGVNELEEMSVPPPPHLLDEFVSSSSERSPAKTSKRSRRPPGSGLTAAAKAKIRDPDLPKRPTNAYLIFCEMEKERIKQEAEEKGTGVVDLSKSMTEAWKNLDYEKRAPYYKLYEEDRDRYKREMEVYNQKKKIEEEGDETPNALKKPRLDSEAADRETPEAEIKSEANEESLDETPSREENNEDTKIENEEEEEEDDDEDDNEPASTDERQEGDREEVDGKADPAS